MLPSASGQSTFQIVPLPVSASSNSFLRGGFGVFVGTGDDFVLVDERADFAARVLEGVAHGGALVVEESDLLGDVRVLRLRGFFRGVYFGEEGFIFG